MAPGWVLLSVTLTCLLSKTYSQFIFSNDFEDTDSCENICENTFPLHTYEKAVHLGYCRRGCRLFTIIDFVDDFSDLNQTRSVCGETCQEAYVSVDNQNACILGCSAQLPFTHQRQQQLRSMEPDELFTPMLYVHSMYSNMVDKISEHMSITWSFFMQSANGQMIVVRSEPRFISADGPFDIGDYKTSNYIESNLAETDNSATPDLKHSQVHAMERDLGSGDQANAQSQASDWLSCIARKTGVPRILLTGTIFVSAFVMIWICLSSAATAPEQRVAAQPQKLSIYGDLEYLRGVDDKSLLAAYSPQALSNMAPPLPIKVKVQRI